MADLLLNTTPEPELLATIFPSTKTEGYCYVVSLDFYKGKGGGSSKLLGVFLSKEKAAQAFIARVKNQFRLQNETYRKHVDEEEDYFEQEPLLEYWAERQVYRFLCENTFHDVYEWRLTRLPLGEMEVLNE